MEFGDGLGPPFTRRLENLFECHRVSAVSLRLAPEGTQLATRHTNIRGVEVAVHIEINRIAIELLAHVVGKMADGQQIHRAIERHSIFEAQALTRQYLLRNRLK